MGSNSTRTCLADIFGLQLVLMQQSYLGHNYTIKL